MILDTQVLYSFCCSTKTVMASPIVAPFKMGSKRIYLPTNVFTLVRGSGSLPPNQAMFHVPLNTNKFDVRDYLYNLYGLVTTNVKVMIQQGELRRGTTAQRKKDLHYMKKLPMTRASSSKRVIITMDSPFIYPEHPKDPKALEPWGLDTQEKMKKRQLGGRRGLGRGMLPFVANGRV